MAFGLMVGVLSGGWLGLRSSMLGWLLGAAILLLPYLLGGIGAGDVKLLAAIGALKGPEFVLWAAVYTAFAGGVLALAELGRLRAIPWLLGALVGNRTGSEDSPQAAVRPASIPYGPAIAAGVVLALLWSSAGA
jgi:prepilin peptidase CpaA